MRNNPVIHITDPYYCEDCDKTYWGYTAHDCEARKIYKIEKGDHT